MKGMLPMSFTSSPHVDSFDCYSKVVEDRFQVSVALPKSYSTDRSYPVVYLTDSNLFFGLFSETSWLLQFGKEIPEIIVVAIGYPNEADHLLLRERDLTPTKIESSEESGGAENFLRFIIEELKPEIEARYSVDRNDCALAGDSYGGLFTLYSLFSNPNEFQRYIVGSPSLYWDKSMMFEYEGDFYSRCKHLSARVFLSAGQFEAIGEPLHAGMLSNTARMVEVLNSRNYRGFSLDFHLFSNETHLSVIPATFSRGLRSVFQA